MDVLLDALVSHWVLSAVRPPFYFDSSGWFNWFTQVIHLNHPGGSAESPPWFICLEVLADVASGKSSR